MKILKAIFGGATVFMFGIFLWNLLIESHPAFTMGALVIASFDTAIFLLNKEE